MHYITKSILLASLLFSLSGISQSAFAETDTLPLLGDNDARTEGVSFSCDANRLKRIKKDMRAYFHELGIPRQLVITKMDTQRNSLTFTLNTPADNTSTLQLKDNPKYAIHEHTIYLPGSNGKLQKVLTVSQKEILLALMQHGRLTEFSDADCNIDALKDHVRVRQNIVAWSENLNWYWPDGEAAEWNTRYWRKGTPLASVKVDTALADAFHNQQEYSIGCYTAAKLVMAHGMLDYYRRVKKDKTKAQLIRDRLLSDQDPLVNIEPEEMWSFETDFVRQKNMHPGKILNIQYSIQYSPKELCAR